VVCATNRSLEEEVERGAFRQDLYYRINVVNIILPPLRERRADIPEIVNYFVQLYNAQFHRSAEPVPQSLTQQMQQFNWPGNVRQLENVVKRYVILGSPDVITNELQHVTADDHDLIPEIPLNGKIHLKELTRQAVRKIERSIILKVLQSHQWNRKKAARTLNISYRALLYKLKEAGLQTERDEQEIKEVESMSANGAAHERVDDDA
jgi:two-component system, NtrC family, response regulator AtoC